MLVPGVPPVNVHDHEVGELVERSVKLSVLFLQTDVDETVKSATGVAANEHVPEVSATICVGPQELLTVLRDIISSPPSSSLAVVSVLRSVPLPIE